MYYQVSVSYERFVQVFRRNQKVFIKDAATFELQLCDRTKYVSFMKLNKYPSQAEL